MKLGDSVIIPPLVPKHLLQMEIDIEMQRSQQCRGKRENKSLVGDSPNYRVMVDRVAKVLVNSVEY